MEITIRDATPADAEPVAGILNPIIAAGIYTALDTPFSVDEERGFIERFPARGMFHVAVAEGRVVGFQNVEPFATYTRAFDHVGVDLSESNMAFETEYRIGRRSRNRHWPTMLQHRAAT